MNVDKVIFSKITRERKEQFQIVTRIINRDGKKYSVKLPCTEEAEKHLEHMAGYSSLFYDSTIRPAPNEVYENGLEFPFVEGHTYCETFIKTVEAGDRKRTEQLIHIYRERVEELGTDETLFKEEPEFVTVFGKAENLKNKKAARNVNVDNILENIIATADGDISIDYEWFFDFLIPYDFVVYRAVLDLFVKYGEIMQTMFSMGQLLEIAGISADDAEVYQGMNEHFNEFVYNHFYQDKINSYEKTALRVSEMLKRFNQVLEIYLDTGKGFNADEVIITQYNYSHDGSMNCSALVDLSLYGKIKAVRIDPFSAPAEVRLNGLKITDNTGTEVTCGSIKSNGIEKESGAYIFLSDDPQMIYSDFKENPSSIAINLDVFPTGTKVFDNDLESVSEYIEVLKGNNSYMQLYAASIKNMSGENK